MPLGRTLPALAIVLLSVVATSNSSSADGKAIIATRSIANEERGENWLSSGRTYAEHQFSPLTAIHDGNVSNLGLAWYLDLPGQRTLQSTPLAFAGALYFSGTNGWVFAVEAQTGRLRWSFDPDLTNHSPKNFSFGSNRGVALWGNKVYVATVDGRLLALDTESGAIRWSVQTLDEKGARKIISGAPRAFNGMIIIGNGGYDSTRGYVSAYDAETGRKLWRFYTVPGDPANGFESAAMAMAAKTWPSEWWKRGGHGTVWDSIVCDPQLGRVYIGTASSMAGGAPGDKLFASSIVALDANTGAYIWHYQLNPGDSLDYEANYDATAPIVMADLAIEGKNRRVLMQAPKNGFFYVVDRTDGRLISAQKIGKVTWADRIDMRSGRPVKVSLVKDKVGWVTIWPSGFGAHDWQKMSYHPGTGLVYIPTTNLGMRLGPNSGVVGSGEADEGTGGLLAWDPVGQKERWQVRFANSFWNGGTLATAGNLVFFGTGRGEFIAYNARTGDKLWNFDTGLGINAAPMTYAVDGVQYISLLVGYGGTANESRFADYGWRFNEQPRRLLTFALGKKAPMPSGKPPRFHVNAVDDPAVVVDEKLAKSGAALYDRCGGCHGGNLENYASIAPDLRESPLALSWDGFDAVVRQGVLVAAGMPKFDDLTEDEARAIYMYVRQRSREALRVSH
jgi:quinohemoprotein ethanol dehydrogenase